MSRGLKSTRRSCEPLSPGLYRHYKGGMYRVLHLATDEATLTKSVVYMSLETGRVWVKSVDEWYKPIMPDIEGITHRYQRLDATDDVGPIP